MSTVNQNNTYSQNKKKKKRLLFERTKKKMNLKLITIKYYSIIKYNVNLRLMTSMLPSSKGNATNTVGAYDFQRLPIHTFCYHIF